MKIKRKRIPQIGDRIIITDYEIFPGGNEIAKIAKLTYLTIESILTIPFIDKNGERYVYFEIYANETNDLIGIDWDFYD